MLKDDAAATYGSDAIGELVNFITRDSMRGSRYEVPFGHIRFDGTPR